MQIPFANQSTIPADYDSGAVTMTRDEAIAIYLQHVSPFVKKTLPSDVLTETAEYSIDGMVALGVLKLDEPKSVEQQVLEIIGQHVTAKQMYSIKGAIHNAKLL